MSRRPEERDVIVYEPRRVRIGGIGQRVGDFQATGGIVNPRAIELLDDQRDPRSAQPHVRGRGKYHQPVRFCPGFGTGIAGCNEQSQHQEEQGYGRGFWVERHLIHVGCVDIT